MSFGCVPGNRKLPETLREVSGVARMSDGNTYWINDGGNPAELFEGGIDNRPVTRFDVSLPNVDWEGLTPYKDSLLCICDIGDNRQRRQEIKLGIIDLRGNLIEARNLYYPKQPYNAEACVIKGNDFYLLTKARMTSNGAAKVNLAYLFKLDLASGSSKLTLKDSLNFSRRAITDMAWVSDSTLAIVAYDYRAKSLFLKTLTSVYSVTIDENDHFRQNTLRERKVLAPFIWTQYESILPLGNGEVMIASEKTKLFPARWRIVSLPR